MLVDLSSSSKLSFCCMFGKLCNWLTPFPGFLELINNMLTSGMVPALFPDDEKEGIIGQVIIDWLSKCPKLPLIKPPPLPPAPAYKPPGYRPIYL